LSGIEKLSDHKLTYDLLLFPKHLTHAAELAKRFPEQKFVLDHIAKPHIKAASMQPWEDDIASLGACSNVWCKISGMVTEADLHHWKYDDFVPYMDVVVQAFGSDRLMLGSDWPVCRLAGEYHEVMNIPGRYFESFDSDKKMKIFKNNAIEFYELDIN
jgi:L-fuconolactonase